MNLLLNNDIDKKIILNDLEQELYDALMDEYNDIFENILNISEKNLFDTIVNNVRAILGEKKMKSFSKITMARALSTLKINNYMQDILSLKNIKEMILSLGNKDHNKKIPELKIEEIFAHCKHCSKCYHTCGEVLLNPHNHDYIFCLKCKMIYKKYLIHLFCKECNEEYYSYMIDYNEPIYEDYFPATWDKYHCVNYICEEMVCPKCDNMLYYNDKKRTLKCFGCKWSSLLKDMKWKCELCDKEFKSGVKEYVKFETKPRVNCVRDALVNKIPARPYECLCCGAEPRLYTFNHYDKKCNGVLYLGFLQKEEITVCSDCRLIQEVKDVKWLCPNCGDVFYCNKIKKNNGIGSSKNNYLLKPNINLNSNKMPEKEKKLKYDEVRIKMAGSSKRKSNNLPENTRGKSFSKKIVMGLLSEEGNKTKKKIQTSKYVDLNLHKIKSDEFTSKRNNYMINEEDEYYMLNEPQTSIKNSLNKSNRLDKISNYILSKKNSKEENSENNLILLNSLQMPSSIGDKKLKYFKRNKPASQKNIYNTKNDQQFINYNVDKMNYKKHNELPGSNKNISLNLQININNINFNNAPMNQKEKDTFYDQRIRTVISGKIERNFNLKKKEKIIKFLENEYNKEINQVEPDENFIPEDFDIIKQIGEGTFGKIFCIEWPKNKKRYAMKKMILRTLEELNTNQEKTNLVFNFLKKTGSNGVIKLYGDQCVQKNDAEYIYYVLMELASIDWEKEIKKRSETKKYYSEGELMQILTQLITSFALLQKNNITHRDIKPQNILIVNNVYKICDFGEAKIITTDGVIQQSIRGTELYMSPILFKALNARQKKVVHNTYKSDVFSLGMCILLAATLTFQSLYDIRELDNMENVKNILVKYLIAKYSYNFVGTLLKMLEVNENIRPDCVELEKNIIGH